MNSLTEALLALAERVPIVDLAAVRNLSWTLLHFLWQGAAIGLVGAIALRAIRPDAARLRHSVACLMLVVLAALPAATLFRVTVVPDSTPAVQAAAGESSPEITGSASDASSLLAQRRSIWTPER